MMKVSAKLLCNLYQNPENPDAEIVFEIGSRLAEIAQTVPTFDQEDHDWGKDAGKFYYSYVNACAGSTGPVWSSRPFQSPAQFLFWEIDRLLNGCHTDSSVADYYVERGVSLFDAIFEWDRKGSLYAYFCSKVGGGV